MIVEITIRSTVIKNQKVQTYTKLCEIGGGDPAHSLFRLSPPTIIRLSPPHHPSNFSKPDILSPFNVKILLPPPPLFLANQPLNIYINCTHPQISFLKLQYTHDLLCILGKMTHALTG